MLSISGIDEGYVIDHIQAGRSGKIVEKKNLTLPETVTNVIKCKNPRCITSIEQEIPHVFKLTDAATRTYRCIYCEEKFK